MCRKKPKARQFFLFNDTLVYGNIIISKKKVSSCCNIQVNKQTIYISFYLIKYNQQHIIPLEEIKLQPIEDDGRKFHLESKHD